MTETPAFSREDTALTLITLNFAAGQVNKALAHARAANTERLLPEEKTAAVAFGVKVGMVTRTKDREVAVVEDEAALWTYLDEHVPGSLSDEDELVGGVEAEAFAVLKQHAPHLVTTRVVAADWAVSNAKNKALAGENVPGVRVETKTGTTNLYPEKGQEDTIRRLIRSGVVSLDGVVDRLLEVEGGQS